MLLPAEVFVWLPAPPAIIQHCPGSIAYAVPRQDDDHPKEGNSRRRDRGESRTSRSALVKMRIQTAYENQRRPVLARVVHSSCIVTAGPAQDEFLGIVCARVGWLCPMHAQERENGPSSPGGYGEEDATSSGQTAGTHPAVVRGYGAGQGVATFNPNGARANLMRDDIWILCTRRASAPAQECEPYAQIGDPSNTQRGVQA
ncbi:hypothetical protein V8D89_002960 [Ganoderma adspersum]